MSPIWPSWIRSCRARRGPGSGGTIRPTPTLRFFLTDSSASASILRVVGPSTVTGFSMKTLRPFSMA